MGASGAATVRASSVDGWIAAKSGRIIGATLIAAAAALLATGRSPVCPCGHVALWAGDVRSDQNSQQLLDWYSLTHLVHGLLFYAVGWLLLRRWKWMARLTLAVLLEAGWEVLENSPLIIDRYRAVTMAFGYSGDSVVNSLFDIGCMAVGFVIARRLPWWATGLLAVALELLALWAIRDNLTLNVLMLAWPVDAVRQWQAGG